jgi:putative zinc finger protein
MNCAQAKSWLSPYLDGALTGHEMQALTEHMKSCADCAREYSQLSRAQQLLTGLGTKKAPPDLSLKLKVIASQEIARQRSRAWQGLRVRAENALNAFMVPATAGAISAVIIFGLLMGFFAVPPALQASRDVPLTFYTPPELQSSAFSTNLGGINSDSLVIEATVDANGRVEDYRVLSDSPDSPSMTPELKNMLIFTVFRPATALGHPTTGRAVLYFSKINVKG